MRMSEWKREILRFAQNDKGAAFGMTIFKNYYKEENG